MSKWSDFGNIWSTLRELDVNVVREEAERPFVMVCVGHSTALDEIDRLLHAGPVRYPALGANPLDLIPLEQAAENTAAIRSADMLLLGVDARVVLTQAEADAFGRLEQMSIPFVVVLLHGDKPASGAAILPRAIAANTVAISDPDALNASDQLATAVLEHLPGELHLAAARRLPGLRTAVGRNLINTTAFTNATYALASGVPEQIPIISIPFAAADILVITKNQAMMVYRLALAYGAPPNFQERMLEVLPVVGGAFVWRQAARTLIGLVPIWGLVPKIAIAYAGTYTTGVTAGHWFATSEIISTEQVKRISSDALAVGRKRAAEIIARVGKAGGDVKGRAGNVRLLDRIKSWIPSRKPKQLDVKDPE